MLYVNSTIRNAYLESKEAVASYPEMRENSYLFKTDEYHRPVYRRPVKGPALSAYYKF